MGGVRRLMGQAWREGLPMKPIFHRLDQAVNGTYSAKGYSAKGYSEEEEEGGRRRMGGRKR